MRIVWIITIAIITCFCSCKHTEEGPIATTPQFDSAIVRAERLYDSGKKDLALPYIQNVHRNVRNLTIEDEMNYFSYCASLWMNYYHDFNKVMQLNDSMLYLLKEGNYLDRLPERHIQVLNAKGDVYTALEQYSTAYDYYQSARKLASQTADYCSLSRFSYSLAMVLYRQKKFKESAELFNEYLSESSNCKDVFAYFYRRQEVLDNIGLCYANQKQYDSALYYYGAAISCVQQNWNKYANKLTNNYETAVGVVLGNMADVYLAMGTVDTAIELYHKSIDINIKKGYTNADAMLNQLKLARYYLSNDKLNELDAVLHAVRAELDTLPDKYVEKEYYRLAWKYYEKKGDIATAYTNLSAFKQKDDSFQLSIQKLLPFDIVGRIKAMEDQHESEMKIATLARQKKQNEILLYGAIVFLIMGAIIIFQVLTNARRVQRNMEMLRELNKKVNEQKEKLETALLELEARDKDKSRILRSVAHDVMSPISAVSALADIILNESTDISEEHRDMLQMIKDACNNSLNLSRDILEAAVAITPGNLIKEDVDISQLVHYTIDLLNVRAAAKGQKLTVYDGAPGIIVNANKEKIWRALNNLITNAIKFSYEGSEIVVRIALQDKNVVISVKDSGVGIPEKSKANIFDMFTESKSYGTSGEKPHGLGLSISLQVARAHGGNIWFESEEGKGATFFLSLPVAYTGATVFR